MLFSFSWIKSAPETGLQSTAFTTMGTRRIFSTGGQLRGLETKVPQQSQGMEPQWVYGGKMKKMKHESHKSQFRFEYKI